MAKRNLGVSDEEMASRYSMDSDHKVDPQCLAGRCGNPPTGRKAQGAVKNFVVGVSAIAQRRIGLQEVVNPEEFTRERTPQEKQLEFLTDELQNITGRRVVRGKGDWLNRHLDVDFDRPHNANPQTIQQQTGKRCEVLSETRIRIY